MKRSLLLASILIAGCSGAEDPIDDTPSPDPEVTAEADTLAAIVPGGELPDWARGIGDDITPFIEAYGPQAIQMSPRGDMVAFRSAANGYRQVYTVPVEGGRPSVRTEGTGVTFFEWTPDGDAIIYGQDADGDEQEAFWKLDLATGERERLLDAVEGGFRSFGAFSGDGRYLYFTSTERNKLDYDLYRLDMTTGQSELVREGRYGQFVEAVSPDGSRVVVSTSVGEDSDNLYLVDAQTGDTTALSEPEPRANHTDGGVHFLDDDTLVLTSNRDRKMREIVTYDLGGDMTAETVLTQGDWDVEELNVCGVDGDDLVFARNILGRSVLKVFRDGEETTLARIPDGVADISCHAGSDTVAVLVRGPQTAGSVLTVDLATGDRQALVRPTMTGLHTDTLVQPESIRLRSRDRVWLQGLLYMPPGVENPPVVFDIHGGPTAQSRPGWEPETQYLLTKGIAVFHPNVRGSTGFGRTYATLDDQRNRLDSVRDLIDLLESEELSSRVDTSRAAVRGGSYGGYMVNAVLAEYPDAFDAGVALFGVGDWVTALEVASPALKASDLVEYGDISDPEWRDFYTEISPIAQADNIRVPVLYSHGERDPRIDIHETEVMVRALRENGIDAEFVRFPDEGHGWRKLTNRQFYMPIEAAFLEKHLMGDD